MEPTKPLIAGNSALNENPKYPCQTLAGNSLYRTALTGWVLARRLNVSEVQINVLQTFCLPCRDPHVRVRCGVSVPAVHHDWTSIRGVAGFHPSQESQERGGVLGYTVVRPRCELELADLPLLTGAVLQREEHAEGNVQNQHSTMPGKEENVLVPGKEMGAGESSPYEGRTFERRMWPTRWCRVTSLESFRRCPYLGLASTGHT